MNISTYSSANNADEDEIIQKQRETFVASLSHDLKNPTLAQIRALELMLKGNFGKILPEQREIVEMLLDSCKYMNAMLGSVLSTYKTDKGTICLSSEKVSLPDLASECIDEMVYLAKDKDIKILFSNTAKKPFVWGDTIQIRRVIMNLLTNCIKYAYNNSPVEVCVYNEKNYTCFQFKNNSPYLSPEKQTKIFARYISFSKAHTSIGLGLYTSKKIVEAHGGNIYVQSFKNEHNIFGFKLPNDEALQNAQRCVTF